MDKYLPKTPIKPEDVVKLQPPTFQQPLAQFNVPGMGGVFSSTNLALYGYAAHNPVVYVDPDGRAVIFKFVDGSEKIAQNVSEFKAIASGAANGAINNITVQGHAPENGAFINFDITKPASKEGLHVVDGKAQLQDSQGKSQGDIGEVLSGKLSKDATIDLQGCNTAAGDNNITTATSKSLPGTPVTGSKLKGVFQSPLSGLGKNVPQGWHVVPFTSPTYVNGEKQ